jgi:hypothetical protein
MGYSEVQLDRWSAWHYQEAVYTTRKHAGNQINLLRQSVATDEPAIAEIATNYLRRADIRLLGGVALHEPAGLRIVQDVGKAAQSYLAYATATVTHEKPQSAMLDNFPGVIDDWRRQLYGRTIQAFEVSTQSIAQQMEALSGAASRAQLHDLSGLRTKIREVALPVCATFITLAEQYGWPQPGVSSTEETILWADKVN